MNIRKIIRETLEKVMDKEDQAQKISQDIFYLKIFSLNKKEEKGNSVIWIFEHKEKDYTLRFYIQNSKKDNTWSAKVFIYWKEPSRDFTNARGKDFDASFGPFPSYGEMVNELNRKLKNNPLISAESYLDDDNTQFDKDVVEMVKLMMKYGKKIEAVKDRHFKDLKKLYEQVKGMNSIGELEKYINEKAPDEDDKQGVLLTLQKMYQLDFYLNKEQIESLF